MDFDTSFEEYTDGKKFIALVVSDNDDDYNSLDSVPEEESESTPTAATITLSVRDSIDNGITSTAPTATASPKDSNVSSHINNVKPKPEEKKRWSFMSNHSSSSSTAKKRWSTLSNFTVDSANTTKEAKDKENKDAKFLKRVSTHSSLSSHKRASVISNVSGIAINDSDSLNKSPTSLKRSSTGSSLRQLFGMISIIDENKESKKKLDNENFKAPSTIPSVNGYYGKQPVQKERRNSNFRTPLGPIINEASRQRHSVMLGNNNNYNNYSNYTNIGNTKPMEESGFHTHSPSISSLSSVASSGSKWKFWKRNSGSLSRSSSTQSLNIHHNNSNPPISNSFASSDAKMKSKTSFSDLHKSIFNNNNSNIHSTDSAKVDISNDTSSIMSGTLSKMPSSSNLSISGLKHRSSQSSLKHKTSHSSLQRFKTRRKSNNTCGPEDASISSSTTSQAPHISLPIPDQVSRDKIRAKLRNSTSLLSLNSSTPVIMKDYDESVLQQILEYCDIKYIVDEKNKIPSLKNAFKLTTHVWKSKSKSGTFIYKKLPLGTLEDVSYSKSMCLQELKMLRLCEGTTGLPCLLHSYVARGNSTQVSHKEDQLFLILILKDHGAPLSSVTLKNWSQAIKIFWQCVTILYVAETKFQFEHRNLTFDHILVDKSLNVTLCDLKCSRAQWGLNEPVIFTRLDHPLFFQGGGDYQFEIYNLMRLMLAESCSWDTYEPRTNLLWLHYMCVKMFKKYDNKLSGSGRQKLTKLAQLLDPSVTTKRALFKRNEIDIKACGDLLRFKEGRTYM